MWVLFPQKEVYVFSCVCMDVCVYDVWMCLCICGCVCVGVCVYDVWMCLCSYGCACVCVYRSICACIHGCLGSHACEGQRRNSGTLLGSCPLFWRQRLSLTWNFSSPLVWPASKPWRSTCLCLLRTRVTGACHYVISLLCKMWVWGLKPQSPWLFSRYFTSPTVLFPWFQKLCNLYFPFT